MFLTAYARFIVQRSYLILFIVSVISTILTVVPLLCHELPSFSDPVIGFETRGTTLAHRFIAWENLIDETRPSRRLAVDPKEIEDQIRMNVTYHNRTFHSKTRSGYGKKSKNKNRSKNKKLEKQEFKPKIFFENVSLSTNMSTAHEHWGYGKNVSYEDDNAAFLKNHTRKQWISLREMQREPDIPFHLNYASGTCGPPMAEYAHLVVTNTDNTSMFLFENIQKLCKLQSVLVNNGKKNYNKMCQRPIKSDICCPVWSVPNYIALISNKNSCENLTAQDVDYSLQVIKKCAVYFHNFTLMASCDLDKCNVPKFCSEHDAVYNLLFYLIDADAFAPPDYSHTFVKNVMLFFPLSRSSTVLSYYTQLDSLGWTYGNLTIPAIDFGLKNALFDLWIIQDTWLVGLGGLFVFLGVWIYTRSLILTFLLFVAITYSLGIAYFLYVYVFNLKFFPFMNLLVIVVVIGIGADDAFIYVKVWKMISNQLIRDNVVSQDNGLGDIKNVYSAGETILIQILEETIRHSATTMFVTTLTTAVAFFASYVSYIPAINCFCIFAGTAVMVNYFLMISWLPASVYMIDVKIGPNKRFQAFFKSIDEIWNDLKLFLNRFIVICVTRLHILFVIVLGAIGIGSIVVVFCLPGLQLPESRQFQLFQTFHPFEQYDIVYKDKFLFEKFSNDIGTGSNMPLRWIWGIKAIDNGNHMDPASKGKLIFDNNFSISDPKSQVWLLNFCAKIKAQPFYEQTLGPLLPNCFIERFIMFMSRRCVDKIDRIDRTPCCNSSSFPYNKEVFDFCIIKAMESLYQTPRTWFMPGVAGPKFLRATTPPKVVAIVVDFESVIPYSMSYRSMDKFFLQLENWTQQELVSAPPGLQCGWFISDLQFYDLQKTLASGTVIALLLSAILGFIVLVPATLNFIVSICALTAMVFSSTVTIGLLVLYGWKLNILESVAISTSAGLAVDFSLHYALSYTNSSGTKANRIKYALTASSGPTAAAAITTSFAGVFLLRSNLLPYSQIGIFLVLIMCVSWIYATFFLCSLLYVFGCGSSQESSIEERKSVSRVSSICSGIPNLESHELEHLADSNHTNLTHSLSPSSTSATTVVINDDSNVTQARIVDEISKASNMACKVD